MKLQLELMELKSYPQVEIDTQRKALEVQQKLIQENYMNDKNWAD